MDLKKISEDFWRDGYVVIENFFSDDLMDQLNNVILDHFGMDPTWEHSDEFIKKSATEVIPWFPYRENNNDFDPIEKNAHLNELTTSILGKGWNPLYLMVMFSKKGTKGQAWHQDSPPEDHEKFNLNRLIYTHDINETTGGQTIVYPKTHKGGAISVGEPHEDIAGQVVLSPKKGSLIILHGHLWHRVLPIKGIYRVSVNTRSIPYGTPEDITDIAIYRNMRYKFSTNEMVEDRQIK